MIRFKKGEVRRLGSVGRIQQHLGSDEECKREVKPGVKPGVKTDSKLRKVLVKVPRRYMKAR